MGQHYCENKNSTGNKRDWLKKKGGVQMKGFFTQSGYMGLVNGCYQLFASEEDYREYCED